MIHEWLRGLRPSSLFLLALATWCVGLAVLAASGIGGRYRLHPDDAALVPPLPTLPEVQELRLDETQAKVLAAAERPLFSEERRPRQVQAGADSADTGELHLLLTGVIATPEVGVATFKEETSSKVLRARVGQPLEGHPQWRLTAVEARKATLEGPSGTVQLELRAFDGSGGQPPTVAAAPTPTPSAAPSAPTASAETAQVGFSSGDPVKQAEAIRARIEARRKQLREAAQKKQTE